MKNYDAILLDVKKLFINKEYDLALKKISKLIKKNKANLDLLNYQAIILTGMHRYRDAIIILEKLIKAEPNRADSYINLGNAYRGINRIDDAINAYKTAYKIDNTSHEAKLNLCSVYLEIDMPDAVIQELNPLFNLNHGNEHIHLLAAEAMIRNLKFEEATAHHQSAIKINPYNPLNFYLLGADYMWAGKFEEAKKNFRHAISLDPFYFDAFNALVKVEKIPSHDELAKKLVLYSCSDKFNQKQKATINFTLSKIFEHSKEFDLAFDYLHKGNKLMEDVLKYEDIDTKNLIEKIKEIYLKKIKNWEIEATESFSKKIIFILGMPRTGSTLIEQILANHESIFAAGELTVAHESFKKILSEDQIFDNLKKIKNHYHARVNRLTEKDFITDKLPLNFFWIGFILKLFPNAKVIHTTRDPIDVCFSIYKTKFADGTLDFSYSQKNIINFYKNYQDIMKFWKKELSNTFIDVNYESLIQNPEKVCSTIFDFVGINFTQECLNIQNNNRPIRTASEIQVRESISNDHQKKWKTYEPFIAEIINNFS